MFSIVPRIIAEEIGPMMRMADEFARWPAVMTRYMGQPLTRLAESEVHDTDKEFRVRMEMKEFKPEEIKISSDNNRVTVTAEHEQKQDECGLVQRHVTRIFKLPDNVDPKSITSTLTDHGILSIRVQKKPCEEPKEIPIPVNIKCKE
ncbi:unnamed protein product [Candidula unifasciata]|uniref:SHSP domain-containing protein n=1 Tax=Candidula unifasciata TaxID=100452 RepID=A0A8S3ZXC1_9EUPU|nr:unnamed protein product [Candidula unifasciata]